MADPVAVLHPPWVLEVGPGPGGLTASLLERGLDVVAIEYDPVWAQWLSATLGEQYAGHLEVIGADAVTYSWSSLAQRRGESFAVCGNLPYYVSSPLIAKLFEDTQSWSLAVVMLQREVAERLVAPPGTRKTSALSVLLRYVADVQELMAVPRRAFVPVPEVESLMIKLIRRPAPPVPFAPLQWIVRAAFMHRRKMMRQSMARAPGSPWDAKGWAGVMESAGVDPQKRPEALSWPEWIALAKLVPTK